MAKESLVYSKALEIIEVMKRNAIDSATSKLKHGTYESQKVTAYQSENCYYVPSLGINPDFTQTLCTTLMRLDNTSLKSLENGKIVGELGNVAHFKKAPSWTCGLASPTLKVRTDISLAAELDKAVDKGLGKITGAREAQALVDGVAEEQAREIFFPSAPTHGQQHPGPGGGRPPGGGNGGTPTANKPRRQAVAVAIETELPGSHRSRAQQRRDVSSTFSRI